MFKKTSFCGIIVLLISVSVLNSNAFDINKDLIFRLYTREEPTIYFDLKANDLSSNANTLFQPNRPTRIFIHGFKSKEKVIIRYKDALLQLGDFNFIAVDWREGASTFNYYLAKGRVRPVSLIPFIHSINKLN